MPGYRRIYRAADGKSTVTAVLKRTRDRLAVSTKLLSEPTPDTFLGATARDRAAAERGKSETEDDETIPPVMS